MVNTRYTIYCAIFTVVIFGLMTIVVEAGDSPGNYTDPITYVSYVDGGFGFYKARDVTTYKSAPFDPSTRTLTVEQGDRVIWRNDAGRGITITVVSEQGLFTDADLKSNTQYNFEQTGTFTFHIKEFPSKKFTVVVNPTEGYSAYTPTSLPTPYPATPSDTPYPTATSGTPYPTYTSTPYPTVTSIQYPVRTSTPYSAATPSGRVSSPATVISFPSMTQIISIVVAIFSIFITYKAGKDR